jgi:hypothetical protein
MSGNKLALKSASMKVVVSTKCRRLTSSVSAAGDACVYSRESLNDWSLEKTSKAREHLGQRDKPNVNNRPVVFL